MKLKNVSNNFIAELLFRWVLNAVALIVVTNLVPGFQIDTFFHALIAAIILGLANALIRPLLFILTLPVTIITLGLFVFVINALMILLASTIVKGFVVTGYLSMEKNGLGLRSVDTTGLFCLFIFQDKTPCIYF